MYLDIFFYLHYYPEENLIRQQCMQRKNVKVNRKCDYLLWWFKICFKIFCGKKTLPSYCSLLAGVIDQFILQCWRFPSYRKTFQDTAKCFCLQGFGINTIFNSLQPDPPLLDISENVAVRGFIAMLVHLSQN